MLSDLIFFLFMIYDHEPGIPYKERGLVTSVIAFIEWLLIYPPPQSLTGEQYLP